MKKSILILTGGFLAGLIIGGLTVCLLCTSAVRELQNIFKLNLMADQEILAVKAENEKDYMRAIVHRYNAIDAVGEDGFAVFRPEFIDRFGNKLAFPFLGLTKCTACATEQAIKFNMAVDRAHLALNMEMAGMENSAKQQWNIIKQNSIIDVNTARNMALKLRDPNEAYKK